MNGRIWYCVNRIGMATACNDEKDALETAEEAEKDWPNMAPHRVMRLVDAAKLDALRTENDRLRAELEAVGAGGAKALRAGAGWVLVPVEPTKEMVEAAFDALPNSSLEGNIRRHYRAMLAASPKVPKQCELAEDGVCEKLDCANHAPQQAAPVPPQKPELRVGQVWRTRGGGVVEIESETENSHRPFVCAIRGHARCKFTVTKNGTAYESAQHPDDLIKLLSDVQKGGEA